MNNSDVVFRRYGPGDEDGIVSVINSSFESFREYGLTRDIWLEYENTVPGFRTKDAWVAEYESKIVGHIQVIHSKVKIGDTYYAPMAGIANVSTSPEMRGRGICTKLLFRIVDQCILEEVPLSGLLAGYGSTAYQIYRNIGYEDTSPLKLFTGTVEDMRRIRNNCGKVRGIRVRHYEKGDEEKMLKAYIEWSGKHTGIVERDAVYWKKKFVERSSIHSFFYQDFDPEEVFIAVEDNNVLGYAYITLGKNSKRIPYRNPDEGLIREIVFKPGYPKALIGLVDNIMDFFISENVKICSAAFPSDEPYLTVFKLFRENPQGIFMTYVTDLERLFIGLREDFEKRLCSSPYVGSNMVLSLETPYGSIRIGINEGEVSIQPDEEPIVKVFFDTNSFTKMLFGVETIYELLYRNMIRIHTTQYMGKVISVIQTLFPDRKWFLCPADRW
ncbi:MAG: GNAT family N-acetyltransferase [Thermoproteota archaeon]